jgi:uncharacterized membrane protein HdeD (DUF308 family)
MTGLARRWWVFALRGVLALALGIATLFFPGLTFLAMVMVFAAYAIVDGAFTLTGSFRDGDDPMWTSAVFRGVVSIVAGTLALVWPGITALVLIGVIASWSIVAGIFEIAAAIRLRKQIRGEWLLVLSGVLSIAFGVMLFIAPAVGTVVIGLWIGAYAMVLGVVMLTLAYRLRSRGRPTSSTPSTLSGKPAHAHV